MALKSCRCSIHLPSATTYQPAMRGKGLRDVLRRNSSRPSTSVDWPGYQGYAEWLRHRVVSPARAGSIPPPLTIRVQHDGPCNAPIRRRLSVRVTPRVPNSWQGIPTKVPAIIGLRPYDRPTPGIKRVGKPSPGVPRHTHQCRLAVGRWALNPKTDVRVVPLVPTCPLSTVDWCRALRTRWTGVRVSQRVPGCRRSTGLDFEAKAVKAVEAPVRKTGPSRFESGRSLHLPP